MSIRQVPSQTLWRVARSTLGRMACEYADPVYDGHVHAQCLVDDEAYAAELILGLVTEVVRGDEGRILDQVALLNDSVKRK